MNVAKDKIVRARASLLQKQPFWGMLALYLRLHEDPSKETMATDGATLFYSPEFVDKLSERMLEGVLAHEVSHCAQGHMSRRGNRDKSLWNEACDHAINRNLKRAGFILPDGALDDPRFDNMAAEEIYAVMHREMQEDQQRQQQQPQQDQPRPDQAGVLRQPSQPGSQKGLQQPQSGAGKADPGGCGEILDAASEGQQAKLSHAEADWRVRVEQAAMSIKADNAGNLPSDVKRIFDQIKKPLIDWREALRRFIDEKTRTDYSWTKPNRRYLGQGIIVPGMIPDGLNQIGVVIDTSGSISKIALTRFVSELQAAIDDGATRKITVICCDTAVKARYDFEEGDQIDFKPVGGGGTNFFPAMKWFARNEPDIAALIYFTDLDCQDFGEEPWVPMIWLGYGLPSIIRERVKRVPFGEVIAIND